MPVYILQALNMRTGLNQLTMSSVPPPPPPPRRLPLPTVSLPPPPPPPPPRRNSLQPRLNQLKSMERIWKKWSWMDREAEIRTRNKLRHWLSTLGYILTYSVLWRENIRQLWVFNRGDLNISASAVPNNKDTFKTKRNEKLQHNKMFRQ